MAAVFELPECAFLHDVRIIVSVCNIPDAELCTFPLVCCQSIVGSADFASARIKVVLTTEEVNNLVDVSCSVFLDVDSGLEVQAIKESIGVRRGEAIPCLRSDLLGHDQL